MTGQEPFLESGSTEKPLETVGFRILSFISYILLKALLYSFETSIEADTLQCSMLSLEMAVLDER
jgi:hypothetical protein